MLNGWHGNPAAKISWSGNVRWVDFRDVALRRFAVPLAIRLLRILVPLDRVLQMPPMRSRAWRMPPMPANKSMNLNPRPSSFLGLGRRQGFEEGSRSRSPISRARSSIWRQNSCLLLPGPCVPAQSKGAGRQGCCGSTGRATELLGQTDISGRHDSSLSQRRVKHFLRPMFALALSLSVTWRSFCSANTV